MIKFTKMHGLGNSYLYINCWSQPEEKLPPLAALAKAASCPYTGVGSDGIILIAPSTKADLKMRIFNKDGSEGRNCGNGVRCVAKYAYDNRLVTAKRMTIETLGGIVEAFIEDSKTDFMVSVNMGKPRMARHEIPMKGDPSQKVIAEPFSINNFSAPVTAVSMGNPHAVFFVTDDRNDLHLTVGPAIEKDARFPEGSNVEFVTVESPTSLRCRVWERGSGPTQACGTGACATAVAAILNGYSCQGEEIAVHLDGGALYITWKEDGNVLMRGPAVTIAEGTLFC